MIAIFKQFAPHHKELRKRLIRSLLTVFLFTVIAYLFIEPIAAFCMQPLFYAYPEMTNLIYTNLTEAFISYIKLSLLVGIMASFPFILYQSWMFIAPALHAHERRIAIKVVLWASLFFAGGALFAFFVVLPEMLVFFMSYAGDNLQPMPKLGLYLSFVARMVLAFAIAFQIPFLMVMTVKTALVEKKHFSEQRKYFYAVIVFLSLLLSAGEPTATVLLSIPMFALYEAGIVAGKIFKRGQQAKNKIPEPESQKKS